VASTDDITLREVVEKYLEVKPLRPATQKNYRFDGIWDNGTQSKLKIVEYDGHHIVLSRRNYEGQYKKNTYRYEGTIGEGGATGTYKWLTKLRFSEVMKFTWDATW
jgi:hypothetical protein